LREEDVELVQECLGEDTDPGDDTNLPVRLLEQFIFFDNYDNEEVMMNLVEMLEADSEAVPEGMGYVASTDLQNLDDEDEAAVDATPEFHPLKLSSIFSIWVDHWDSDGYVTPVVYGNISNLLDRHVWVQTTNAWYILGKPSRAYHDIWMGTLHPIVLAKQVCAALQASDTSNMMSWDDFIGACPDDSELGILDADSFGNDEVVSAHVAVFMLSLTHE
jgi:hypothetical protein